MISSFEGVFAARDDPMTSPSDNACMINPKANSPSLSGSMTLNPSPLAFRAGGLRRELVEADPPDPFDCVCAPGLTAESPGGNEQERGAQ